jgi:hypothetical protein
MARQAWASLGMIHRSGAWCFRGYGRCAWQLGRVLGNRLDRQLQLHSCSESVAARKLPMGFLNDALSSSASASSRFGVEFSRSSSRSCFASRPAIVARGGECGSATPPP